MMNSVRYSKNTLRMAVATALSYLLVLSLCVPLSMAARPLSKSRSVRAAQQQSVAPYREHELLVRFRAGTSELAKDTILATQGARRKKKLGRESGVERLELRTGSDARAAALELLLNPQIEFVEPNFLISKEDLQPNDPQLNAQWSLRNTGQNGGQYGSDINAATAWQTTTGSAATVIAVIDSGIDFTHPDLANNQWTNPNLTDTGDLHGWDFITDSAEIKDEQGHGTAVAGIIAAEGNNSLGITGVMWRASLMSLRVLDNTGTGDVAGAVEAIDYAVAHGAHVINLSWGTSGESAALRDAIERAIKRNVVVVCSAGNGGGDLEATPYYPASFKLRNLISVAASDNSDQLAAWSNWGAQRHPGGARNKHTHHAKRWRLLECDWHVGSRADCYRHRRFTEDRQTAWSSLGYCEGNHGQRETNGFARWKSFEWRSRRRRRCINQITWLKQPVTAFSESRTREWRKWTRRQFLDTASNSDNGRAGCKPAESGRSAQNPTTRTQSSSTDSIESAMR